MSAATGGLSPRCHGGQPLNGNRSSSRSIIQQVPLSGPAPPAGPSTSLLSAPPKRCLVIANARRHWYAVYDPVDVRGVYRVWEHVKQLVFGKSNSMYKGFHSELAALKWIQERDVLVEAEEAALRPLRQQVLALCARSRSEAVARTLPASAASRQAMLAEPAAAAHNGHRTVDQDDIAQQLPEEDAASPRPWEMAPIVLDVPSVPTREYYRKYYAVRFVDGGHPGVYNTWQEAEAAIHGRYSEHRSFRRLEDAMNFAFGPEMGRQFLLEAGVAIQTQELSADVEAHGFTGVPHQQQEPQLAWHQELQEQQHIELEVMMHRQEQQQSLASPTYQQQSHEEDRILYGEAAHASDSKGQTLYEHGLLETQPQPLHEAGDPHVQPLESQSQIQSPCHQQNQPQQQSTMLVLEHSEEQQQAESEPSEAETERYFPCSALQGAGAAFRDALRLLPSLQPQLPVPSPSWRPALAAGNPSAPQPQPVIPGSCGGSSNNVPPLSSETLRHPGGAAAATAAGGLVAAGIAAAGGGTGVGSRAGRAAWLALPLPAPTAMMTPLSDGGSTSVHGSHMGLRFSSTSALGGSLSPSGSGCGAGSDSQPQQHERHLGQHDDGYNQQHPQQVQKPCSQPHGQQATSRPYPLQETDPHRHSNPLSRTTDDRCTVTGGSNQRPTHPLGSTAGSWTSVSATTAQPASPDSDDAVEVQPPQASASERFLQEPSTSVASTSGPRVLEANVHGADGQADGLKTTEVSNPGPTRRRGRPQKQHSPQLLVVAAPGLRGRPRKHRPPPLLADVTAGTGPVGAAAAERTQVPVDEAVDEAWHALQKRPRGRPRKQLLGTAVQVPESPKRRSRGRPCTAAAPEAVCDSTSSEAACHGEQRQHVGSRGRGRPRMLRPGVVEGMAQAKRPRGRPRKQPGAVSVGPSFSSSGLLGRPRGRPRKDAGSRAEGFLPSSAAAAGLLGRRPGRPRKDSA